MEEENLRRRDTTENRCEGNCECDDSQHDIHFSKSCTSQSSFHGFKFGSYSVSDKRLGNEIRILSQSKFRNCFTYNDSNGIFIFTFNMKVTEIANSNMKEKDDLNFKIMINTKDCFPFFPPSISFDCNAKHILFDVNKLTFEEIMQESWHPSLRIIDIIERSEAFILPLLEKSYHKPLTLCPILYLFEKVTSSIAVKTLIILFAVIIRIICNIMYYESTFRSHFNTITHTLNNKIVDWYKFGDGHEFQTYPPLYGYLYYLVGMVQKLLISTPAEEIRSVDLKIAVTSALDYNTNNYICIALLTLLEAFTLYSGVYMCVKSFYRKLTNQVKHSVILLALVCPVYLIANVLAIRFNSIMIGLMIWAVYFCVNSKSKMCVLCTTLAIHIEPKAFIFVLPMIIYTLKVNVVLNVINNESDKSEMKDLIKEITDKSFTVVGSYVVFFIVFGLIWLPWILIEDLSGMADVASIAYMPENDLTLFLFKFMMFALIMGYNLRALIIKTTKKIILITLFNLSVGYCICFTMNADSISLIITCGFLAFYELREVSFIIITSCIYSIYPDVVKLECYSLYFISSAIYLLLYKMFMNDLLKLIKQESTSSSARIQFQDSNQDCNLDNVGKPMIEHRKSVKIISDHHNGALRFIGSNSTLIEVSLCICLLVCINIEIYLSLTLVHGVLMRGLMLFILAISHLILSENLSSSRSEAFGIDVKEKNS